MSELQVVTASAADDSALDAFLRRSFGAGKADFLRRHGDWWHRGSENRWALLDGDTIAGYCGVIPTQVLVGGTPRDAVWWMDLVIAPEYRGRGLQTRFDDLVRSRGTLLLGFPNELAARIHRHHGWGVREDLRTLLLPLRPHKLRAIRRASGVRGFVLRSAAQALRPAAALWRTWSDRRTVGTARRLENPDFETLARAACHAGTKNLVTTSRSAGYLRWRYAEGPHHALVYAVGSEDRPGPVLIARRIGPVDQASERWLDVFGDLEDEDALVHLFRRATKDAIRDGVVQITVLAASSRLRRVLRRTGFILGTRSRFCWYDEDREIMGLVADAAHHWGLGDSDNDDPERRDT